jgi:putative oxidoreductase
MLAHGIPKLLQLLSGNFEFGNPIGVGPELSLILTVIGEAICPMLIIIGFRTRLMTIPTIITMLVAAFIVHATDDFYTKEKALLYLFGFVAIALLGGGKFGVSRK